MTRTGPFGLALALAAMVVGCATPPDALRGEYATLDPSVAARGDTGSRVRWGGRVLDVAPERARTCLELLALPLDRSARPRSDAPTGRRFLACREGFIDPAAFPEGRLVTVAGQLSGFEERPIGDYDYRFPVVTAMAIHLWPQPREPAYPDPYPYYHYPYWHPDPFHHPWPRHHHRPYW